MLPVRTDDDGVLLSVEERPVVAVEERSVSPFDEGGYTALHWAALNNRISRCSRLLQEGISPNTHSNSKERATPLHWAALRGHLKVVKLLMSAGADPNVCDALGYTSITHAAQYGRTAVIHYLALCGGDVLRVDNLGHSILGWSAYCGHLGTFRALLALGADPCVRDSTNRLPHHWAAVNNHGMIIREMVLRDPRVYDERDINGHTCYDIALKNKHRKLARALRSQNPKDLMEERENWGWVTMICVHLMRVWVCLFVFPRMFWWIFFLVWAAAAALSEYFLFRCMYANPGRIRRSVTLPVIDKESFWENRQNKICYTCKIVRPRESKHCRTCDMCVAAFDHHCGWLNTCIGAGNVRLFHAYCVTQFLDIMIHIGLAVWTVLGDPRNPSMEDGREWAEYVILHDFHLIGMVAIIGPFAIMLLFLSASYVLNPVDRRTPPEPYQPFEEKI